MSIVLQGSTSGSITLQEPAIAGSTVLSLPATTGTVLTSASPSSDLPSSINGPAFSAHNTSSQSISSGVATKVILQTELFDTANCFDNSTNYRFTPNVAGYYQITGRIRYEGSSISGANIQLYKNGSIYSIGNEFTNAATQTTNGLVLSDLVYLNGSTDYVELYGFITATSPSFGYFSSAIGCKFSGVLVRAA